MGWADDPLVQTPVGGKDTPTSADTWGNDPLVRTPTAGDSTPTMTVRPTQKSSDLPVPFPRKPNENRANILPFAYDDQGKIIQETIPAKGWRPAITSPSIYVPEFIAAPIRGMVEGGQEALGERPVDDPEARGDIAAAAGMGVGSTQRMFTTAEERAAEMFRLQRQEERAHAKTPQGKAESVVTMRFNEDVRGGGGQIDPPVQHGPAQPSDGMPPVALPTHPADNMAANLDRMRAGGKPAMPVDVGGPAVRGLAGDAARRPGPGQAVVRSAMEGRDVGAGERAQADVRRYLTAGPSAYRTSRDLIAQRSQEGDPLYKKAFEGGSIAPLKDQFETAWSQAGKADKEAAQAVEVAKSQLNAALAKDPVTQGNVYSASAANDAIRAAQRNLQAAEANQQRTAAAKQQILEMLQRAQDDIANNTPGAVWNPRIQEFLDNREIRAGLKRGIHIQANDMLAEGVPFNVTEYAMTPEGEVISVPNMRTLNVAKKGLDAIVSENRDEFGRLNEYGRSVDKVRQAFVAEIDKINPDYAAARQSWAGHSASLDALKWGKNIQRLHPEQIAEEFAAMSEGEKEFARLGVADTLMERIGKTTFSGDEAKALIRNQWTQDQLQPLFRSQEDFTRYIESVAHERLMKEVQNHLLAGSQTAERHAATDAADAELTGRAVTGVAHLFMGHPIRAISEAWRIYRNLGLRPKPEVTEAIARALTDPEHMPSVNQEGEFYYPPPSQRVPRTDAPFNPGSP